MSKNFNTNTDNQPQWLTPPYILQALGSFDLDPCAPCQSIRPWDTAKKHYTKAQDGLVQPWQGRVWCNPPYGRQTFKWIDKLSSHGNGIALIFARTQTIGFHQHIWNKADSILFIKGRLKFHTIDGKQANSANAPSCLVAYGQQNVFSLYQSGIQGRHIVLK